ncbi:NADPH-dependent FMN reductase [Breoghania sp.]|uniref:NADPH-dependent FMN reductase n=1 Tax=Breoghania sp. TaxID=2065378 RepID=UPI0026348DB4|nr:NADPH-dependent FMN reductase [Breoghania sp.]MDJ0931038.1 NADPH-dependent FMN reductase [Breoghania sp.]
MRPSAWTITEAPGIGSIPPYNSDVQGSDGVPADVTALAEAIHAADVVIIASPEYNCSMLGVLKNALDWVSRTEDQPFKNKPVCLQSVSMGQLGGARMQYHLGQVMVFLGADVFTVPEVFIGAGHQKFDADTLALTDGPTREVVGKQLAVFVDYIGRVSA